MTQERLRSGFAKTHQISAAAHRHKGWVYAQRKSPTGCKLWYKPSEGLRTHVDNGPSVYNLAHLWIFSSRVLTLFLLSVITTQKILLHLKLTEYVTNYFLFHARSLKLPQKKSTSFCSQQLTSILHVFWHLAVDNYWLPLCHEVLSFYN